MSLAVQRSLRALFAVVALAAGAFGAVDGPCEVDSDGDGVVDCNDGCPADPLKVAPGACGCSVADTDTDGDLTPDCNDGCSRDPLKVAPGTCGCGVSDVDTDGDAVADCNDGCPADPAKTSAGICGCGVADVDTDGDSVADCIDGCPSDPSKTAPGTCGCGAPDVLHTYYGDDDGDGYGETGDTLQACTQPKGYASAGGDCDDSDPSRHPMALEVCGNLVDDDCDTLVDEGPAVADPIVAENQLAGTPPAQWDIVDSGHASIQGYAARFSVRTGETVDFKVKTDASAYHLEIYRIGWYGGMGARLVTQFAPSVALPQTQPDCVTEPATGLIDCGTWHVSASWFVPCDAVSGVYVAKLVRDDAGFEGLASHVHFVVRDDESASDLLFQTSDTTWQAYNSYGGASLYRDFVFGLPDQRAYKVSYNRPFNTRTLIANLGVRSFFFNAEYPMIRWLERNGYDVSYCSGLDTDRAGAEILEHRAFVSCGHDEYWSLDQRRNVERARDLGVHLAFFSGDAVYWKTRYESSIDGSNEPHKTLVCFKETLAGAKIDPLPGVWTGTWRDPRFSPPNDGRRPENALTGTIFTVNGERSDAIRVPAADAKMRFWRNTGLELLVAGSFAQLSPATLGYEWDEDLDNGFRPHGLVRLSSTRLDVTPNYIADFGATYGKGNANHALTFYKAPSGARVFSAGTIQWSWGLDGTHDRGPSLPDARMQQATVNLLADLGVQARTLQPELVAATASTDELAPSVSISSPKEGWIVASCDVVTISGTATDAGGGRVGGIEVSTDEGASWHPAAGRDTWTYAWMPEAPGLRTILARAVDDSGNLQAPPLAVHVERREVPGCPQMLYGPLVKPTGFNLADLEPFELGVKFRATVAGHVRGIRFFKPTVNPGGYTVRLWSAAGVQLGQGVLQGGARRGWQQVNFLSPIAIQADTTYVASYHSPGGGFPYSPGYFTNATFANGNLRALQSGLEGANGVYRYGATGFPTDSFNDANYWVDVVFTPAP